MTDQKNLIESDIDNLLAQAADTQTAPSADLLARVAGDADDIATTRELDNAHIPAALQPSLLARAFAALGGWPAVAGLTTASVAGIWIGYAAPDAFSGIAENFISIGATDALGDFMPAFTDILSEG